MDGAATASEPGSQAACLLSTQLSNSRNSILFGKAGGPADSFYARSLTRERPVRKPPTSGNSLSVQRSSPDELSAS